MTPDTNDFTILDVDTIGSQEPLTVEEQNQLSEYFSKVKTTLIQSKEKTKSKKNSK